MMIIIGCVGAIACLATFSEMIPSKRSSAQTCFMEKYNPTVSRSLLLKKVVSRIAVRASMRTWVFSSIFSPRPFSARTVNANLRADVLRGDWKTALVQPGRRRAVEVVDKAIVLDESLYRTLQMLFVKRARYSFLSINRLTLTSAESLRSTLSRRATCTVTCNFQSYGKLAYSHGQAIFFPT